MANEINIAVGADIKDLQNGLKLAVSQMEKSGKDMSQVGEQVARLTSNNFKSLSQAYRTTSRDAEVLALHLGTESDAFKQAALMAQSYGEQLSNVRGKIAGIDMAQGAGGVQKATTQFNGLSNSINQLTREMPAFTYSVQTGFMAISNNIPMFVDQLQNLKRANQELAASGQPTQSVFKQVASSFFSFNTVLSVGITLLTVFGGKLYDYLTDTKEAAVEINNLAKAQENFNKVLYDFTASPQKKELDAINKKYKDATIPLVERLNLLKEQIALENSSLQVIGNQEKYYEKINAREVEMLNLESDIKAMIVAKNAELDKVNQKYDKQVETLAKITKLQQPTQLNTRLQSGSELNAMAGGALGDTVADSLAKGWARIHSTNLKGMGDFKMQWKTFEQDVKVQAELTKMAFEASAALLSGSAAALGAALTTGDFEEAGKQIVRMLGGIAMQIGAAMVAMGIPMTFAIATAPEGIKLIAGGLALGVAGGAMQASGMASKNSPTPAPLSAGGGGSQMSFNPAFASSSQYLDLSSTVRGTDIVISADNQRRNNRRIR